VEQMCGQYLDGNEPAEPPVFGLPDRAHSALTELCSGSRIPPAVARPQLLAGGRSGYGTTKNGVVGTGRVVGSWARKAIPTDRALMVFPAASRGACSGLHNPDSAPLTWLSSPQGRMVSVALATLASGAAVETFYVGRGKLCRLCLKGAKRRHREEYGASFYSPIQVGATDCTVSEASVLWEGRPLRGEARWPVYEPRGPEERGGGDRPGPLTVFGPDRERSSR